MFLMIIDLYGFVSREFVSMILRFLFMIKESCVPLRTLLYTRSLVRAVYDWESVESVVYSLGWLAAVEVLSAAETGTYM
jgi:hypothetical protein